MSTITRCRPATRACPFPLFTHLPIEIRVMIYSYIDDQESDEVKVLLRSDPAHPKRAIIKSLTPAPRILQMCRESRMEGLKHYCKPLCYNDETLGIYVKASSSISFIQVPIMGSDVRILKVGNWIAAGVGGFWFYVGSSFARLAQIIYVESTITRIDGAEHIVLLFKLDPTRNMLSRIPTEALALEEAEATFHIHLARVLGNRRSA
ncbi:hypothetical protein PVAG01_10941 [Phlyctema vagabunda]|uniref:2EXR domain-containing protein n=1 Tax=Phlyctema vagabunda TaxID=108571 RepID=A0ABR4P3P1_9HELO